MYLCIYVILFIDYNLEDIDEDFYKFVNFDFFDGSSEESLLSSDSFDLFFLSFGDFVFNDYFYDDFNDVDYDDFINGKDLSSLEENGVFSSSFLDDFNDDSGLYSGDDDFNSLGDSKLLGSNSDLNSNSVDNSDYLSDDSNGIDDSSNSKLGGDDKSS